MTLYPNQIDNPTSLPPASGDDAVSVNASIDAIEAIEQELGIVPSGMYASVRTRLDILETRINNPFSPAPNVTNPFFIGNTGVTIQTNFGDPGLHQVPATPGSLYLRQDGYTGQGLYQFEADGYWHNLAADEGLVIVHPVLSLSNTGGNYNVQYGDEFLPCTTVGGSFSVTLPSLPVLGKSYTVTDVGGAVNNSPLTIFGNGYAITGSTFYLLTIPYESITLLFYGSGWAIT